MKKHRNTHILAGAPKSVRDAHYKLKSKTVNITEDADRSHLEHYVGMTVKFSGELRGGDYRNPTVMLKNVSICGDGLDHVWVLLSSTDRKKLGLIGTGKLVRVYMEGVVRKYVSSSGKNRYIKHGVQDAKLVTNVDR
jgi:citrate lyase alpha subunit